jgi:uncharacterized protein (UPF0332 family)
LPQSWSEISRDALQAATVLHDKHPRSSISRAYYAAFSAAVWLMWQQHGVPVAGKRETPQHREMPKLLEQLLYKKGQRISRDCRQAMRLLYNYRLNADYQSSRGHYYANDARNARILASSVMKHCGVIP